MKNLLTVHSMYSVIFQVFSSRYEPLDKQELWRRRAPTDAAAA